MAYTLISMIGTGMYKTRENFEGYEETTYFFDNDKQFKTRLFMQAILLCQYRPIDQIILLGTDTSSWDCYVDKENDARDETVQLWCDLVDQCESSQEGVATKGVDRETLDKLEKYLSQRFSVEVIIKVHTHNIDNNTSKELFECYTGVTKKVKKGNDILFDITHGFRSMPVLLYQSLQYLQAQSIGRSIELVYGELDLNDRSKGHVRNLNNYWNYSELTNALTVFNEKLDGFKLSELIEPLWLEGSKAIKRFSEIVQTNFSLQIIEVYRQLKNALEKFPKAESKWLIPVKQSLKRIIELIDKESVPRTLYNYSKFLYEHHLNVQAVITLQVAVETMIVDNFDPGKKYGDYDWWEKIGSKELYKIKGKDLKNMGNPLNNLEYFRNQIAHGGSKNKDGNYPQAANIPNIYKSGIRGVEALFAYFGV